MHSIAEIVRDAVHDELLDVAAAIKPPDSGRDVKHLPDAGLIAFLITQALIPILTAFIAGMLQHMATREDADATRRQLNDLDARLKALSRRNEPEDAAVVDAVVGSIAALKFRSDEAALSVGAEIGLQVAAELRRFHLSDATSARLAPVILARVLALLAPPPPPAGST
jgi:hypothetical protein